MRIKYQASLFSDLSGLGATPENTLAVMTALNANGIGLLPQTIHEISHPNVPPVPRLRLVAPNGDVEVLIATGRLDIVKQVKLMGAEVLEPVPAFSELVDRVIASVFGDRTVLGSRLAFIVQEMSDELTEEAFNTYFHRLFSAPNFYNANTPTEWTFRANARSSCAIGNLNEPLNTILKVERVQGQAAAADGQWREFDRVMTEVDINTLATNVEPRFSPANLRQFVEATSPLLEQLEQDTQARLTTA